MIRQISRRDFIRRTGMAGIAVAAASGAERPSAESAEPGSAALKGFIVSDAHFGWQNEAQPKPETIREMMGRILRKFPGLDVFIDTGDAHHNGVQDDARGEWTDIILSGCGPLPFYYVAGNHEIMGWGAGEDVEMRCNRLGSVSCRPYYSFDIKGIHFISLPELMMVCYISTEALEWMALDLALNRDKTTIVLSHNSIAGTTEPHDDLGYRRLANSAEVFEFLNQYPNIAAWMHGHNHTWEVARKQDKFYVSNGRIGGFDPPYPGYFGRGHLGGIYFEVARDRLTVRGFSASRNCFFDELDHYAHLTQSIALTTSLDPAAPACVSYGHGGMRDGQRLPVINHHAGTGMTQELFVAGAAGPVFNENPGFGVYSQRTLREEHTRMLPAYAIEPADRKARGGDPVWTWTAAGIRLHAHGRKNFTRVSLPRPPEGRHGYYRCAPGRSYRLRLELECDTPGVRAQIACAAHDAAGKLLLNLDSPERVLDAGAQSLGAVFDIPALADSISIYSCPETDDSLQVNFNIVFRNLGGGALLRRAEASLAGASGNTIAPAIMIDGHRYAAEGELRAGQHVRHALLPRAGARFAVEAEAGGNRRLTWLLRQRDIAWQVRNAPVSDLGGALDIGPLRNTFSPRREVIIAPMTATQAPFVHRLRHINRARIHPFQAATGVLSIEALELLGDGEIDVVMMRVPKAVQGADEYSFANGLLFIRVGSARTIHIETV